MTAIARTPPGPGPAHGRTPSASTSTMARVFEHRLMAYRHTFRSSLFSSFVTPTLFLAAMGVGLGSYVDTGDSAALGGISYLAFLAPGLLAASAMNSASFEATFPIMGGLIWSRTFHGMYATPISVRDITLGNLAFTATRQTLIATVFTVVIVLFGAATSPLIVLAIPAAVLTGMAFAAPIAAFSATQKTPEKFNALFRFVITPLFLFSGTFFPVSSLPPVLQSIAWFTPLYHGVSLTRGLSLGTISEDPIAAAVDVVFLSVFVIVGTFFAIRTIGARLVRG
jgi:lipooligosaccharide transport system permease protein